MKMKRLREERGVSLRQIADVTRISISALEALERNEIARLPGGIYSRAFVRSYAIEVGLDPEQTVHDFLSQFPHDSLIAGSPHAAELRRVPGMQRTGTPTRVLAVLVVIGAVVLLVLFLLQ